jgi:hypothetical protein
VRCMNCNATCTAYVKLDDVEDAMARLRQSPRLVPARENAVRLPNVDDL